MRSCIAGRAQTLGNSGPGCLRAPSLEGQVMVGWLGLSLTELHCDLFKVLPAWHVVDIYSIISE